MVIGYIRGRDVKRYYRSEERRPIGGAVAALALIIGGACAALYARHLDNHRNDPEVYVGFEQEQAEGYQLSCQIDTKGDVTKVKRLQNKQYQTVTLDDGTIIVSGEFEYEVRRQGKFAPDFAHTDSQGHSPETEGDEYFRAIRQGKVILKRASAETASLEGRL